MAVHRTRLGDSDYWAPLLLNIGWRCTVCNEGPSTSLDEVPIKLRILVDLTPHAANHWPLFARRAGNGQICTEFCED